TIPTRCGVRRATSEPRARLPQGRRARGRRPAAETRGRAALSVARCVLIPGPHSWRRSSLKSMTSSSAFIARRRWSIISLRNSSSLLFTKSLVAYMRPAPRGTSLPLHVQQVQHSVSSIRRASYLFGRKTGDRQAVATALGKLLRRALEALVREEAASRR